MAAEEAELEALKEEYLKQQEDMAANLARLHIQMTELESTRSELEEGEGRREALEGRLEVARHSHQAAKVCPLSRPSVALSIVTAV